MWKIFVELLPVICHILCSVPGKQREMIVMMMMMMMMLVMVAATYGTWHWIKGSAQIFII